MKPIDWAEKVIKSYVAEGRIPSLEECKDEDLVRNKAGCFVTIHGRDGSLRGCIGTLSPSTGSLAEEIRSNALSSATRDPRFPPLSAEELDDIFLSVDVLEKPEECSIEELDPKEYGIVVELGARKGVLLPDLAGVNTVADQIRIALAKAGISEREDYKIYRFKVTRYS